MRPQASVKAVVFSPDGSLVATGTADNMAWVFETGPNVKWPDCRLALGCT